jgi:hypothetical protein
MTTSKIHGVPVHNDCDLPTSRFKHLLAFAIEEAGQGAQMAHIQLRQQVLGKAIGGLADMFGMEDEDPVSPSTVTLWLSSPKAGVFPHRQQFVPEVPAVEVRSWDEEFLLVASHELKHILQFWSDEEFPDQHLMEVDAEAFAIRTLLRWRASQVRRLAA